MKISLKANVKYSVAYIFSPFFFLESNDQESSKPASQDEVGIKRRELLLRVGGVLEFLKFSVHVRVGIYLPYSNPCLYLEDCHFHKGKPISDTHLLINKLLISPMTIHL